MRYICKKHSDSGLFFYFNGDTQQYIGHNYWNKGNLLYMNIPKCASSSISDYLAKVQEKIDAPKSTFRLTFLREPIARLKSAFRMKHRNLCGVMSDKDIIEKYMGYLQGGVIPYENYNDMLHFVPQHVFYSFLKIKFDFVGTVEQIEAGIEQINGILGVSETIRNENQSEASKEFNTLLDRQIEKNKQFFEKFLKEDFSLYHSVKHN